LEDILIRFLVSLNAYDEDFFRFKISQLGAESDEQAPKLILEEGGRALSHEEKYICARFLKDIASNHPEYIPYLARLASIGLITEVVEDFVKPTSITETSDLVVLLDAPMALHYLGLSGKEIQADVKNVLDALKNIGIKLMMFPESCEEMVRNLSSMLALNPPNRHGYNRYARGDAEA